MHIMDEANGVVTICKVFFRFKNQKWKKVWVGPKGLQALNNIPSVEFEALSSNYDLMALEVWMGQ